MQRLTLDQIEPAMALARPATDGKGRTLIAKGVELSQSHIDQLRRRGVETVWVEGQPIPESDFDAEAYRAQRIAFLDQAFGADIQAPGMDELKTAFLNQMEMRIQESATASVATSEENGVDEEGESPSASADIPSH